MAKPITFVDPLKLDEHFATHADEYKEWADTLAEAEADLDDLTTELELVKAEVADAIRREPVRYGAKGTVSETMIDKLTPLTAEYQAAKKAVNDKKREVGKLKTAVKALDRKGTAIEKLTALWLGGYYAAPRLPRGITDRGLPPPIDKPKKGGK